MAALLFFGVTLRLLGYGIIAHKTIAECRRLRRIAESAGRNVTWYCLLKTPRTLAHLCLFFATVFESVTVLAIEVGRGGGR